ncbi:hypothetical protein, partial [Eikenella corrodens]|uniref:hypothetical protein n=1 Tax=Eikenella corrodens TaxID=539 RepID=UPI00129B7414
NGLYKLGYKQHTRTDEEGYIEKLHIATDLLFTRHLRYEVIDHDLGLAADGLADAGSVPYSATRFPFIKLVWAAFGLLFLCTRSVWRF